MPDEEASRTCFVISPIGKENSDERKRSDQVLRHIIEPAVCECGYKAVRADQMDKPGLITTQIIQRLLEAPLVIGDLTGWNPNVFYELAIRHAVAKPIVQLIHRSEKLPFDVAASRTILYDHQDLDRAEAARESIVKQIRSLEKTPGDFDTPLSSAIELQTMRKSEDPVQQASAEILTLLHRLQADVRQLREKQESCLFGDDLAPHGLAAAPISLNYGKIRAELDNGVLSNMTPLDLARVAETVGAPLDVHAVRRVQSAVAKNVGEDDDEE